MSDPDATTWRVHLAARHPGKAVAAVVFIILGLFAFAAVAPDAPPLLIALAGFLLLASIAEFLFPVTYTLDAEGAHARLLGTHRVLAWRQVRRVYMRRNGIKLSPLTQDGWMEAYRGVFLRTPDRDAVAAQVRRWLDEAQVAPVIIEES